MDGFVQDFLNESSDSLEQIDSDLLALEREGTSKEALSRIFRNFHSMKGCAQFLGFSNLTAVTHAGESLLSRLRDGHLAVTPEIITGMLAVTDATRAMLASIGATGNEVGHDYADLIRAVEKLEKGETGVLDPAASGGTGTHLPAGSFAEGTEPQRSTNPVTPAALIAETPSARVQAADEPPVPDETAWVASDSKKPGTPDQPEPESKAGAVATESSIRVDVGLLDRLMTLVGELVLARNQILQYTHRDGRETPALQNATQRLDAITTDLQEGMMKTRMQPIRNVWNAVPRVVRDLCRITGKKVRVVTEGELTELDKTVLEAIKDPITHMVRNAVDHGIESPEARIASGKHSEGTLSMRAWHEGGQVNIELTDDGKGIDAERVKRKAIDRGILREDQAARMSDREAVSLIFRPGFSTAESLTMISGRGVGMDVVKSSIEAIGGSVEIVSVPGAGSTFKLRIPLTLAILKALIIVAGEERYAIPQVNLVEIIRLENAAAESIETLQGVMVYRYRGRLLPIVNLNRAIGIEEGPCCRLGQIDPGTILNIVVLQAERSLFGLVVDRIVDPQEIVVRPLAKALRGIEPLAGSTILGDGRVALILDVFGLSRQARVATDARTDRQSSESITKPETPDAGPPPNAAFDFLVMEATDGTRQAISLDAVRRLEVLDAEALDLDRGFGLIQHRDKILHILDPARLGREANAGAAVGDHPARRASGSVHVVVIREEDRPLGLLFGGVVDIVRESVAAWGSPRQAFSRSSAILAGQLTDILDTGALEANADLRFGAAALRLHLEAER